MMPDLFRARVISNVALLAEAGVLYLPSRVWAPDFSYVMNTPASVWGDYNNDIDGADFGIWQANYPFPASAVVAGGAVSELFDDLIEIGLNMFNPFQPEVMDVFALKNQYHGRLAFHGGMGTQSVLPLGTPDDVRDMTKRLIEAGRDGGYIFSPSHAVPSDVPPENLLAMMELLRDQPGAPPK